MCQGIKKTLWLKNDNSAQPQAIYEKHLYKPNLEGDPVAIKVSILKAIFLTHNKTQERSWMTSTGNRGKCISQ